jgi:CheY-like chemotaxis protein
MDPVRLPITRFAARNQFRGDWKYRRTPAGDDLLAVGKGLSPAFFALLAAIEAERATSFTALDLLFTRLDADDLELWLAELCRMRLIAPAQEAAGLACVAPATTHCVRVLLVHRDHATRQAWRALLADLAVELVEAESLEHAEAAYNQLQPQAILLGPGSSDFNTLELLHVLKHPRAPRPIKAFLMLEDVSAGSRLAEAAARADEAVPVAGLHTLAQRISRQLGLEQPQGKAGPAGPAAAAPPAAAAKEIAREVVQETPGGVPWKHKTLETLYNELLAICAELEARDAPPAPYPALAA